LYRTTPLDESPIANAVEYFILKISKDFSPQKQALAQGYNYNHEDSLYLTHLAPNEISA